jgi:DNA-directed RNA polymerase specialized sigma24 family protein
MLRRRGVQHHDIDEIVQETAARVISTGVPYDDADDLFRWAAVVGGRLAIDLRRRGARLSGDELPDRADTIDVALAAEHRVVLGAVVTRLPQLSARDQEVLLSGFEELPATSRRESVRVAVARHRARGRLRHLLDGLAGLGVLAWARRNRLWSVPVEAISYAAVPAAACVLMTVCAWGGLSPSRAAAASDPRAEPQTAAYMSTPRPSTPSTAPSGPGGGDSAPPLRPPPVPPISDPYIVVDDPTGQTRVGIRDKEESDHLWCVTTPGVNGHETRCLDSPVPLPPTP